jgi:hypothetical protein
VCIALFGCLGLAPIQGQDKKEEKKDTPKVLMSIPLGVCPGVATKVTLRGLKLDTATALRFPGGQGSSKIIAKKKVPVPKDLDPAKLGDTEVVAHISLPPGIPSGSIALIAVTPTGETPAHSLLVEDKALVTQELEPNNGFRKAQPIVLPRIIDGVIDGPQDVDVFRFEGQAGQRVTCEVLAARHGSPLDSVLTLYDAGGREVASNDDIPGSSDSRLEVTLPRTGSYYLSVMDANDQGGSMYAYRLVVRPK